MSLTLESEDRREHALIILQSTNVCKLGRVEHQVVRELSLVRDRSRWSQKTVVNMLSSFHDGWRVDLSTQTMTMADGSTMQDVSSSSIDTLQPLLLGCVQGEGCLKHSG